MKYLIVKKSFAGELIDFAILFPEIIQHRDAVNLLAHKPVAAGFCEIEFDPVTHHASRVTCWGRSDSLNLFSRPELDAEAIKFSLSLPSIQSPITNHQSPIIVP